MFKSNLKHIFSHFHLVVMAFLLTFTLVGTLNITTQARCTVSSTPVTIANIIKITDSSHYPIIPNGCTGAISPESLPAILIRSYGFISSLGLNLFFFFIVYNGLLWIYSGIDGGQSAGKAKKNIQNAAIGLALIFFAYVFVNTFVTVFVAGGTIPSIQSFFNTNVN
jgi:Type IV secretion system pilin